MDSVISLCTKNDHPFNLYKGENSLTLGVRLVELDVWWDDAVLEC